LSVTESQAFLLPDMLPGDLKNLLPDFAAQSDLFGSIICIGLIIILQKPDSVKILTGKFGKIFFYCQ